MQRSQEHSSDLCKSSADVCSHTNIKPTSLCLVESQGFITYFKRKAIATTVHPSTKPFPSVNKIEFRRTHLERKMFGRKRVNLDSNLKTVYTIFRFGDAGGSAIQDSVTYKDVLPIQASRIRTYP